MSETSSDNIEVRELTEREAVRAVETIGDTPVYGIFEDGKLLVVGLSFEVADAQRVGDALSSR